MNHANNAILNGATREEVIDAAAIGVEFGGRPSLIITTGWIFAAFVLASGRFLAKRRHHMFCLVIGGVECIFIPFGTVLGVFTINLLMRESMKQLFTDDHSPQGTATETTS